MADIEKLTVTLEANVAQYNADLAQAAKTAQQQTAKMEQSFAKLGTFGQRSPKSLDTIAKGMSSIGKTALASQVETELLNASLKGTGDAAVEVSHAIGAMSTQGMAAFHALRGGTEMLAQGADPFRVLAMEMNNLTYAASGAGGLKGAFGEAIGIFTKMLNPVTVLAGGLATLGVAATAAAVSYANAQSRIKLALTGVGASGGVTLDTINKISEATASAGQVSVSEARDFAAAVAATGRTSVAVTAQATALAKSYSLVFGDDLQKSAKDLGAALADPARGVDTLNARLLAFDATTANYIKRLTAQGNLEEAQKTILAGIATATATAAEKTTGWAKAWDALANSISNYINAAGKAVLPSSFLSPEDQLAAAKARLAQLQSPMNGPRAALGNSDEIAATKKRMADLNATLDDNAEASRIAASNLQSLKFGAIIDQADPATASLHALEDQLTALSNNTTIPLGDQVAQLKRANDQIKTSVAYLKQLMALGGGNIDVGATRKQSQIDIAAINARTAAQKAAVAYDAAYMQAILAQKGAVVATAEATAAANKSMAQSERDLAEAQRDRTYAGQAAVDQANFKNSLIGKSAAEVAKLTTEYNELAAAKQEAFRNGILDANGNPIISAQARLSAMADADQAGRAAGAGASLRLNADADFDRQQALRSQDEQQVYAQLHSAGLLGPDGQIQAQDELTAAKLRTNQAIKQGIDAEKAFASTFAQDMLQGKSAAAALADALNQLASKLLDMGLDKLISGANSGGLLGGIGSLLGLADGGHVSGPGSSTSDSIPAMLSNGEFVVNADATKKHRAVLEAINTGKVGKFAAGGSVGTPAMRMPNISLPSVAPPASSAPQIVFNAPLINAPNATPAAVDKMNQTSIPALKSLIRSEVAQAMTRSSKIKNIIRKG